MLRGGGNLGSCPLLTPPARRLILTLRINKAILKCAAIVVRINLKPDLKRTNKPSAQDKTFFYSPIGISINFGET